MPDPVPFLVALRRENGDVEVLVDAAVYDDPSTLGIVLAELPGHIANAYAHLGMDPGHVQAAVWKMLDTERARPTGKPHPEACLSGLLLPGAGRANSLLAPVSPHPAGGR